MRQTAAYCGKDGERSVGRSVGRLRAHATHLQTSPPPYRLGSVVASPHVGGGARATHSFSPDDHDKRWLQGGVMRMLLLVVAVRRPGRSTVTARARYSVTIPKASSRSARDESLTSFESCEKSRCTLRGSLCGVMDDDAAVRVVAPAMRRARRRSKSGRGVRSRIFRPRRRRRRLLDDRHSRNRHKNTATGSLFDLSPPSPSFPPNKYSHAATKSAPQSG